MRYLFTLVLVLTSLHNFAQQKKVYYDQLVDSFVQLGRGHELIPYFHDQLKSYPKNETILNKLGLLYTNENSLDTAERFLNEALAINPSCGNCYMNLGRIYAQRGDLKKSMEMMDKAVASDPRDGMFYIMRAQLKESAKDEFGALFDFNKGIELDPKNAAYYLQRGIFNLNQGYYSLALADINQSIALKPKDYYAYYIRARLHHTIAKFPEAMKDLNQAIALDSTVAILYLGRGTVLSANGEAQKAIDDFTKAIALDPDDYLGYYNRSLSRYNLEDMDGACSDLQESLQRLPAQGAVEVTLKDIKASIGEFCDSTQPSYFYHRGIAYYNQQAYQKAVDVYSRGLNYFPANAMTLCFRGNAHLAMGHFDSALFDYYASEQNLDNLRADVKKNPKFAGALPDSINAYLTGFAVSMQISKSEAKFGLGLYEEALKDINAAIDMAAGSGAFENDYFYNVRGNYYLAMDKLDEAIADFDLSIRHNAYFPAAYANRALARISKSGKVKARHVYITGKMSTENFHGNWILPLKTTVNSGDANLIAALADCEKAIALDPNYAYAYYIRGHTKRMLVKTDYCYDFLKAEVLGMEIEKELLKGCK